MTEASLNGLLSSQIAARFREDPYRFLVCADKFQTGYDEPLLHTMYVDKTLSGIKAVQTLSRLNRAHQKKHDVFVLDFLNDADTIRDAFADFYRATILADETDPNKLHDLQADLDGAQVYAEEQVEELTRRYLGEEDRDRLDPILDACVAVYRSELDEDGQVAFKGGAKAFVRTYAFLSSVLPYTNAEWEKRSIFLNFLIPKLPAPEEEDLSKGILDAIDLDSYRVENRRCSASCCRTRMPRSIRCPATAAAAAASRSWTGSRTSCARSTSTSATSGGRTPTACGSSSSRPFPRVCGRTRPSATPSATRTGRTPASSTTRRWCA